jgi:hypothetical protein
MGIIHKIIEIFYMSVVYDKCCRYFLTIVALFFCAGVSLVIHLHFKKNSLLLMIINYIIFIIDFIATFILSIKYFLNCYINDDVLQFMDPFYPLILMVIIVFYSFVVVLYLTIKIFFHFYLHW